MLENTSTSQCKGTIIFSPHPDDAALSIGGILHKKALEEPITLVTVFGRSNYTRESAFQSDWETVTAIRKNEDAAFANALTLGLRYLEFPEASLRLGPSLDKMFFNRAHPDAQAPPDLCTTLTHIIDDGSPNFLVVPLGLGYHHDHLLINQLSYQFIPNNITCVIYYEDLPYAADMTEKQILQHISCVSVRSVLTPVYVSIDHELCDKLTNLRLYQSQIGSSELNSVKSYASHWAQGQFYERVWVSKPSGAALLDGRKLREK